MKKLYFILPIVGVVIFYFFVAGAKSNIKAKEEARKVQTVKEQAERAERDVASRKAAFELAFAEANRKIAQAEARKQEEARQAAEVQAAKDARDLVYRERERQNKRLTELTESRTIANENLARVREMLNLQNTQMQYLTGAKTEVVQNKMEYEQALTKIDLAEKAFNAQEAARVAAAKRN